MKTVSAWLQLNRLTLNAEKTKCMAFGTQQRLAKERHSLLVLTEGKVLEVVPNFKYLGLWLDSPLKGNGTLARCAIG